MGNGQNIIDKILSDANIEATEIINKAKAEAQEVIEAAKIKSDKETAAIMEIAKEEAAKTLSKEISSNEMLAKKMLLQEKQNLISEVIIEAREKLYSLTETEYKVIVIAMLEKAAVGKDSEVILSSKDRNVLSEEISKRGYKISAEEREIEGGFIVKKGDIEYNYSFDSIISVEKEEIERLAAQALFN